MEKSKLVPFLRHNLDILFIGLNPAKGSNDNGHYFSVNQAFWNQLYDAELIGRHVDKLVADNIVFGDTNINFDNWQYGITDLVTEDAESDSSKIKPTREDCIKLIKGIEKFNPETAIILHSKALSKLFNYLNKPIPKSNTGKLGRVIENCNTEFFSIAFPHNNSIKSVDKVEQYKKLKQFIITIKQPK
jgi:hypothetical protein